ncbi:hypothetical protein ACIRPH_09985 [Nocardiopsis sp. NPDC101807]
MPVDLDGDVADQAILPLSLFEEGGGVPGDDGVIFVEENVSLGDDPFLDR